MRSKQIGAVTGVSLAMLLALGGVSSAAGRAGSTISDAANQRAAILDTESHLAELQLPSDAVAVGEAPSDGAWSLQGPSVLPDTPNLIDSAAWWELPDQPPEVLAWLETHPPPGSSLKLRQSMPEQGVTTFWLLGFDWPPIPGEVDKRTLIVTVTPRNGGGTALRADAQDVWVVPHLPSERIPMMSRLLEVKWERGNKPARSTMVTNHRLVRKIATLIDGLPVVQPRWTGCPAERGVGPGGVTALRLRFLAHRQGASLSEATQVLPSTGTCSNPFELTIHNKRQPLLDGGSTILRALNPLRKRVDKQS